MGSDLGAALAHLLELPQAIAEVKADLAEVKANLAAIREAAPAEHLSVEQAARRLNMSQATVRRMIKRGDLVAIRIGRSVRVDLRSTLLTSDDNAVVALARRARGGLSRKREVRS